LTLARRSPFLLSDGENSHKEENQEMPKATFMGHACVTVTDGTHNLIIDPFLTDNPQAAGKADDKRGDHGHLRFAR
jgi:L-ascorbate metabolism protein UlaG (beta-lactamase superfamily)